MGIMPTLTRRLYPERDNCWHIYYGDIHAGTIAIRTGNPHDTDPWEWSCGFYPGSHPGEHQGDTAAKRFSTNACEPGGRFSTTGTGNGRFSACEPDHFRGNVGKSKGLTDR